MKYLCCLFLLWLVSCARPGTSVVHTPDEKYQRLSAEIENSHYTYTASVTSPTSSSALAPEKEFKQVLPKASQYKLVHKSHTPTFIPKVISRIKPPRLLKEKYPLDWENKRDNIAWKIGYYLLCIGLLIFLGFGAVFLKASWGVGLLIAVALGLGLMALSLPFLLIGWLIGNKSDPAPTGPDDPVQ